MAVDSGNNDPILDASIDFICAGSSALALSLIHLYPGYGFLSPLALVPFLWRSRWVGTGRSMALGAALAGCFCFVALAEDITVNPTDFVFRLLALTAAFSILGVVANITPRYVGYNPVFLALVWPVMELLPGSQPGFGQGLKLPGAGQSFALGFCSLSGCLLLCIAIVLIDSLILLVMERWSRRCPSQVVFYTQEGRQLTPGFDTRPIHRIRFYSLDPRAPPRGMLAHEILTLGDLELAPITLLREV